MSERRKAILSWALVGLTIFAFMAMAVTARKDIERGVYKIHKLYFANSEKPAAEQRTILELCREPLNPNHRWRWYTKVYPGPGVSWYLFEEGGVICHGNDQRWDGYPVKLREVKQYGCFETDVGLFCRHDSTPDKHPRAMEILS